MRPVILLTGVLVLSLMPASAEPPARTVTLPFDLLKSKHLAVQVRLNGRGPYRVIFDTGAPILILNTKSARESGVLPGNVEIPRDTPFNAAGQFPVQRLEVGAMRLERMPAMVMDHPAVASLAKGDGPLDGIIGYPFFSRYRTTVDYSTRQLTFRPNGYEPEDVLQLLADRLTSKKKPPPRLLDPAGLWGIVVAKDEDDDERGVDITKVRPGTAAAMAGLMEGDRLLTLDGRWTESVADVYEAASHVNAGTAAPLLIRRDGKEKKLSITPAAGL
jgi:hypothetical protein